MDAVLDAGSKWFPAGMVRSRGRAGIITVRSATANVVTYQAANGQVKDCSRAGFLRAFRPMSDAVPVNDFGE